jgi:hypothetical protein
MEENIKKIKDSIIDEIWTEDFHHSLSELEPEIAKQIVDSMSDKEIEIKVNSRRFQEDYIADYLHYLWDISKQSYWNHVYISINEDKGLLWGDSLDHFAKMYNYKIPKKVLKRVVVYYKNYREKPDDFFKEDIHIISCVLKAQVEKFERWNEIIEIIKTLNLQDSKQFKKDIKALIKEKCRYPLYEL